MIEFKRILVPLDGSSLAEKALPVAMALAQKFESHIILLRVVDSPGQASASVSETLGIWRVKVGQHASREAEGYLKIQRDELRQDGFDVSILLYNTSPTDGVLKAATDHVVDLIVMSTHGRGGLARWAVGSVADKVARHSPCPVLLVRQKPEDTKELQLAQMTAETGDCQ